MQFCIYRRMILSVTMAVFSVQVREAAGRTTEAGMLKFIKIVVIRTDGAPTELGSNQLNWG